MKRSLPGLIVVWLVLFLLSGAGSLSAGEYKIGTGDVLEVKFWQDPALNSQVRVDRDGMISLDIIGEIRAGGKTTRELENDVVRQISRLNKRISQAVIVVVEYNYNYVFVTGQVTVPGKLSFEEIPDLWTIINEAGAATEFGDLSRVTIIRGGKDAGKVEIANVSEAIARGELDKLPKIRREDTIEIPRTIAGVQSSELARTADQRNVIYVIGAVTTPGPIAFEEDLDIVEALALAGGPTATADLKKTKVITKDGYYGQSLHFNLHEYSVTGALPRYVVRREDAVIIPEKGAGLFGVGIGPIAAAVGVISSAVFIYLQVKPDDSGG